RDLPRPPWGGSASMMAATVRGVARDFASNFRGKLRGFAEEVAREAGGNLVGARRRIAEMADALPREAAVSAWEDATGDLEHDLRGAFEDDWGEKLSQAITASPDVASARERVRKMAGEDIDPGGSKDVWDYADEPLGAFLGGKADGVVPGFM